MADPIDDDPYLWLEEIRSDAALTWARERTGETEAAYDSPTHTALQERLHQILDDPDRVVVPSRHGAWMYNLWKDAANPRGLWRRASRDSFAAGEPQWEVLIDVDALGRDEGTPWAFAGASHGPRGSHRAWDWPSAGRRISATSRHRPCRTKLPKSPLGLLPALKQSTRRRAG